MKNFKSIYVALFATVSILFAGCDNFNGEQDVPAYIRIKGFRMVANPNMSFSVAQDEGFLTSDVCDVWVFVTDHNEEMPLGAYSLTKEGDLLVPVLSHGKKKVELRPGIKYNGMAATREYYRFYTTYIDSVNLEEGRITDIDVQDIMYNNYTRIAKCIMFDQNTVNPFKNADSIENTAPCHLKIIDNDSVAYGSKCGAFYSASSKDDYVFLTKDSISCTNKNAMILEMDYHSNIPFNIGLYGQTSSASKMQYINCMEIKANDDPLLSPSDKKNWKKMYIILGKVWGQLNYQDFRIWFQPDNKDNNSKGFVHIDNLKVIHFPE